MAGSFDREGSIQIFDNKGYLNIRVSIPSDNDEFLKLVMSFFGGKIYKSKKGGGYFRLYFFGKKARYFLESIYPYLIIKKYKVKIALDFCKTLGQPITEELKQKRNNIRRIFKDF